MIPFNLSNKLNLLFMKKIMSYNVNGIRAAITKDFSAWLEYELPDVICIQETKAQPDQIDADIFKNIGYDCYCHSALKKGYSGVAILTRIQPDNVFYGMNMAKYDAEGRVLRLDFGDVSVISVYIPSGSYGDVRQDFKMEFLEDFKNFIDELRKTRPNLIISGDYNICHKAIDINHPERQKNSSGFLPEEREWFDSFIDSGFVDTFREFDKSPNKYSWWTYRAGARGKNLGWRIDYHLVTESLKSKIKGASILSDVFHSDHCPVVLDIDF